MACDSNSRSKACRGRGGPTGTQASACSEFVIEPRPVMPGNALETWRAESDDRNSNGARVSTAVGSTAPRAIEPMLAPRPVPMLARTRASTPASFRSQAYRSAVPSLPKRHKNQPDGSNLEPAEVPPKGVRAGGMPVAQKPPREGSRRARAVHCSTVSRSRAGAPRAWVSFEREVNLNDQAHLRFRSIRFDARGLRRGRRR